MSMLLNIAQVPTWRHDSDPDAPIETAQIKLSELNSEAALRTPGFQQQSVLIKARPVGNVGADVIHAKRYQLYPESSVFVRLGIPRFHMGVRRPSHALQRHEYKVPYDVEIDASGVDFTKGIAEFERQVQRICHEVISDAFHRMFKGAELHLNEHPEDGERLSQPMTGAVWDATRPAPERPKLQGSSAGEMWVDDMWPDEPWVEEPAPPTPAPPPARLPGQGIY